MLKSLAELKSMLEQGQISAQQLTKFYLDRSQTLQKRLNGYITMTGQQALTTAQRVDEMRQQGQQPQSLAGIPVAIKDNISTQGIRTTCASRVLENYIPPYSAHVVDLLDQSPMLGKASLDEFAMGSTNDTSAFGAVTNPWHSERVPGGSSGGSAALVAAGAVPFSLGSDTGGSIRQPAAFCGVTGFKPSYGRVSRRGLVAYASSLDQIGPITRSIEDCALVLDAICGHDPGDSTSARLTQPNFTANLRHDVSKVRIGLPQQLFDSCTEPIRTAVISAAGQLEAEGASLTMVSMPYEKELLAAYILIANAEMSSNLARFDGVGYGHRGKAEGLEELLASSRIFGPEVRRRLMLGTFSLSAGDCLHCYQLGQKARQLVVDYVQQLFRQVDVLLLPTTPTTALSRQQDQDPLTAYYNDIFTLPANLAGLPAVSVPCGLDQGLPIGMQLVAPRFGEDLLLQVAYTWQNMSNWHKLWPPEVE